MKKQKLIIYGLGETAEIISDYFIKGSKFEVIAFTVDKDYMDKKSFMGRPVVEFENVENVFNPKDYFLFAAASFNRLNRVREKMYKSGKLKGYRFASYIHKTAFVWDNVEVGENVFIFENNVVQYGVKIENNVIMWSGNHIGHRSVVEQNCFISSHVVISGYCKIERNTFIGVNSSINDKITVGYDSFIGSGSLVVKDLYPGKVYVGSPARAVKSSLKAFNINGNLD